VWQMVLGKELPSVSGSSVTAQGKQSASSGGRSTGKARASKPSRRKSVPEDLVSISDDDGKGFFSDDPGSPTYRKAAPSTAEASESSSGKAAAIKLWQQYERGELKLDDVRSPRNLKTVCTVSRLRASRPTADRR